ncbi:helix-turn-helix domain-containing protein [Polycyclovorans algicola]|uniref:helix-turn-helix domain-containing protein n=1 Tax=Polycyclovorans algicola TaxID=616992 RepID=UPI0006947C69|nr:AraC family transcriptional regulator [Polycyclovorans algicola]
MTAHILAQLMDSSVLDAAAVARFRALLQREGRDLPTMVRQGEQTPLSWFGEVFDDLDADQAATMGYAAGEQARLTSFTPLSLPLVSAANIHEALRLLAFLPLIANVLTARFIDREDDVAIVLTASSGDPILDRFPVFYCAAALMRLLRLLASEPLDLVIHIAWPQPAGFDQHPECQAGRLRFDAPLHHIVVPRSTLLADCRFADPIAYQTELTTLQDRMVTLGATHDITERVRHLVDTQHSLIAIDDAARQLHMTVSTLKRRLSEANTSFRALRESVLKDRAMLLLTGTSLSLESIASALGYSDLANFSHAFKRWTGTAPGAFRKGLTAASVRCESSGMD